MRSCCRPLLERTCACATLKSRVACLEADETAACCAPHLRLSLLRWQLRRATKALALERVRHPASSGTAFVTFTRPETQAAFIARRRDGWAAAPGDEEGTAGEELADSWRLLQPEQWRVRAAPEHGAGLNFST